MLLTRVLSALVLAPVAFAAAWFGGWLFIVFWTIAAFAVLYEWTTMVQSKRSLTSTRRVLWIGAGFLYAGSLAWAPNVVRGDGQFGFAAIVFLFAIVWTTDIAGYFAGRAIGGPKLAPAISPKKTWSGAIAGLAGSLIVVAVGAQFIPQSRLFPLLAVAILLSIASQTGDLAESAFKRYFDAKDASQIIPGHGGVMDRLDGFWAAALFAAMIGIARGGFAEPAAGLLIW